jgi:lambda repressor-like predicted transcriptional regulator
MDEIENFENLSREEKIEILVNKIKLLDEKNASSDKILKIERAKLIAMLYLIPGESAKSVGNKINKDQSNVLDIFHNILKPNNEELYNEVKVKINANKKRNNPKRKFSPVIIANEYLKEGATLRSTAKKLGISWLTVLNNLECEELQKDHPDIFKKCEVKRTGNFENRHENRKIKKAEVINLANNILNADKKLDDILKEHKLSQQQFKTRLEKLEKFAPKLHKECLAQIENLEQNKKEEINNLITIPDEINEESLSKLITDLKSIPKKLPGFEDLKAKVLGFIYVQKGEDLKSVSQRSGCDVSTLSRLLNKVLPNVDKTLSKKVDAKLNYKVTNGVRKKILTLTQL